jgi:Uma2 family endonuclease
MNRIFNRMETGELYASQEQCSLVYRGTKKSSANFSLVDVSAISNVERFIENITELEHIEPDLVMFKDNPYLENKKQTRTAGQPDLIIEVWSESNTDNDRAFLQNLYATSDITEHWYIEQNSNRVECYLGKEQLPDKYLTDILITQKGIEFDLRRLAVPISIQ